jgi:hypothetical protein
MAIKKLTNTSNISNTGHYWGTTGNTGISGTTTTTTTGNPYWINTPGQVLTTGTNNTISWTDGTFMNSDIVEYIDIFYQLMGIDMDYERFSKMTKEERISFIRDLKLQKLIDEK